MKKEELIAENAKLAQTNKEQSESDQQRRKSLSVFLNAPFEHKGMYDREGTQKIYSWSEIYFHLGKLMARRDYKELSDTNN